MDTQIINLSANTNFQFWSVGVFFLFKSENIGPDKMEIDDLDNDDESVDKEDMMHIMQQCFQMNL